MSPVVKRTCTLEFSQKPLVLYKHILRVSTNFEQLRALQVKPMLLDQSKTIAMGRGEGWWNLLKFGKVLGCSQLQEPRFDEGFWCSNGA